MADVAKHKHITIKYCPTDKMIGNFFTKPLGGAKFRRFRNIIMNCSYDEHGPVDVDASMEVHQKRMEKRIIEADTDVGSKDGSTVGKTMRNVDPQECVGTRFNAAWATIRSAHTNGKNAMIRPLRHDSHQKEWLAHGNTGLGRSYAQVVASEYM